MKEIGSKLRDAREKKNLSIQDVSTATKINIKTIQSIEDGDLDSLPAKPFLRGFIQTYAKYLELDVDNIMKQFLEIQGSTKPRPLTTEELAQTEQSNHEEIQKRVELYKKIAYAVAALLAIVLIYVIHKVVSRYEAESKNAREQKEAMKSQLGSDSTGSLQSANGTMQPPAPPAATTTTTDATTDTAKTAPTVAIPEAPKKEEAKKEEPKKEEVKKEEPKKEEAKNPEPAKKEEVKKVEPVKKEEPKKEEPKKPEPVKKEEPKKPEAAKKEEVKKEEPKKEEPKAAKKGKPQEVIIEALDNVEIRYVKDGEGEKTVRLKPEQVLTIRGNSTVSLDINDSGAVNIIHNGQDKGVPGSLGQSTKINYP